MIKLTSIFTIFSAVNDMIEIKKEICGNVAITRLERKNVLIDRKTKSISINEKSFNQRKNFFTTIKG